MNLVWFLNNLRCSDNEALTMACAGDQGVVALYCFDPAFFAQDAYGFARTGPFRAQFLLQTLQELSDQLSTLSIPLLFKRGDPSSVIAKLVAEYGITDIFLQQEWTRDERRSIEQLQRCDVLKSVSLHTCYDQFLLHPADLPYADFSDVPQVFTEFRKTVEKALNVRKTLPVPAPRTPANLRLASTSPPLPSLAELGLAPPAPDPRSAFPFSGGSNAAHQRLRKYLWESENITRYKQTRNGLIGTEYSSKLSPWLANGSLSAREIYRELQAFERDVKANEDTYWLLFELLWRDFFKYTSLKHGDRIFYLGGIRAHQHHWQRDPDVLHSWIRGETPCDFVNANMREFALTGWMSNRGRQNVASYWAREMQQDWRIGAAWFESQLVDYDVHSNYGNWMYNSGVGNDPRDRRFNIDNQAERYDQDRRYRDLWLRQREKT